MLKINSRLILIFLCIHWKKFVAENAKLIIKLVEHRRNKKSKFEYFFQEENYVSEKKSFNKIMNFRLKKKKKT